MVKHLQAAVDKKGRHKRRPEGDDDQIALEFREAALLELNGVGGVLLGETIAIGVIYSPRRMVCQVIIKNDTWTVSTPAQFHQNGNTYADGCNKAMISEIEIEFTD